EAPYSHVSPDHTLLSQTWLHLAIGMTILTCGEILSLNATVSITGRLAPQGMIGRYMGIWGLSDGVARAVGPWFGSIVFEQLKTQSLLLWLILSVPAIVCSAVLVLLGNPRSFLFPPRFLIAHRQLDQYSSTDRNTE
ncbi:MAG: PucC family protein, partial [Desulfofustis sp.]